MKLILTIACEIPNDTTHDAIHALASAAYVQIEDPEDIVTTNPTITVTTKMTGYTHTVIPLDGDTREPEILSDKDGRWPMFYNTVDEVHAAVDPRDYAVAEFTLDGDGVKFDFVRIVSEHRVPV